MVPLRRKEFPLPESPLGAVLFGAAFLVLLAVVWSDADGLFEILAAPFLVLFLIPIMLMGMVMGVVHALGHFIIDLLTDIFNWIGSLF